MEWLFVIKDRGTRNAGYWLKISSVDELVEYMKITNPKDTEKHLKTIFMVKIMVQTLLVTDPI